jgi:hypothetical protein
VGGPGGRLRADLGRGLASVWVFHRTYVTIAGLLDPTRTGYNLYYEATIEGVPWTSGASIIWPQRLSYTELGWIRIHVSMDETQTSERVAFTYLDLATTFLSIIGASAALVKIIVGPGMGCVVEWLSCACA